MSTDKPLSPNALFRHGLDAHIKNDTQTAERFYLDYLDQFHDAPAVLTNLAAIHLTKSSNDQAYSYLEQALSLNPNYPEALSNLASIYLSQDNSSQALQLLNNALDHSPLLIPALSQLLTIAIQSNDPSLVVNRLDHALTLDPSNYQVAILQADLIVFTSSVVSAIDYYRQLIASAKFADSLLDVRFAYANFLVTHLTNLTEAIDIYDFVIASSSSPSIVAYINKGEALRKLGLLTEALSFLDHSCRLFPHNLKLENLRGCIYLDMKKSEEALNSFLSILKNDEHNPQYIANCAIALVQLGRFQEALLSLRSSLSVHPRNAAIHQSIAQCCFAMGFSVSAERHFRKATEFDLHNKTVWDNYLYFLSFTPIYSERYIASAFRRYASLFAHTPKFLTPTFDGTRKLRIGIISAEIGAHAVSHFLASFVNSSSRKDVDFYLYPTFDRSASLPWHEFKNLSHVFSPIFHLSDDQAYDLISSHKLDVLIETTSHMDSNRLPLLSRRMAPLQAHYIGMHGTTGTPNVDYFIGDDIITPESFANSFSERFLKLPRTWVCFSPQEDLPQLTERLFDRTDISFGCFNNFQKITTHTLHLWSSVLQEFPSSTLFLKDSAARSNNHNSDRARFILRYFVNQGINPTRLKFVPHRKSWADHMTLYNQIDIALDTTPLSSGTTAFDSLAMGVPILAAKSDWIGGRLSTSIVTGMSHPEWAAFPGIMYLNALHAIVDDLSSGKLSRTLIRSQFLSSELCDAEGLSKNLVEILKLTLSDHQPGARHAINQSS